MYFPNHTRLTVVKAYSTAASLRIFAFFVGLIASLPIAAQCSTVTPSFTLNLTGSANASAVTPSVARNGTCCGGIDPCVKITVLLHPNAAALRLTALGADPGGALNYEMNCSGLLVPSGSAVCVSGSNTATLTICKAGNNPNSYSVVSFPKPSVTDPEYVRPGCTKTLTATGFSVSTIQWTAVNGGTSTSLYNSFLNCTAGCSAAAVSSPSNAPAYVDYEVSGYGLSPCESTLFRDTARVWFYDPLGTSMSNTLVCYGGSTAALTASVTGGKPAYTYTWSPGGSNSNSISATAGTYTLTVNDQTGCPPML
jgi:large repetitive protein